MNMLKVYVLGPRPCSFRAQGVPILSVFSKVILCPVVPWAGIGTRTNTFKKKGFFNFMEFKL
jgi:hypothetical protein